jgi:hypothetical protein
MLRSARCGFLNDDKDESEDVLFPPEGGAEGEDEADYHNCTHTQIHVPEATVTFRQDNGFCIVHFS